MDTQDVLLGRGTTALLIQPHVFQPTDGKFSFDDSVGETAYAKCVDRVVSEELPALLST